MSCFDIDSFKIINDQYGSTRGDDILKQIAHIISEGFSSVHGLCSRMTSDNFAMLYPLSFTESGELEKIRKKIAVLDGNMLPLSFSIGRYIVDDLTLSISAMYDRALMAKNSIKGRFDIRIAQYDESMRKRLLREQEITSEMYGAVKARQFVIWLQPQYNHADGSLIGAEVLSRWSHPLKGLVSPFEFIPVFEKNGFIYEMDKYIWEETCVLIRRWIDEGFTPLPLSVNISRYDIFKDDMYDVLTGFMKKYGIPVRLVRLEITESAFAKSTKQIIEVVKALIDYGFTIEIDDFGCGYSSLNTLKDVPAQIVKLDMKFLEEEGDSDRGGNIVESVIRMTKWLGMSVIAEGVETKAQADYLESIGCSYIQGYLYARPMPVSVFEKTIVSSDNRVKLSRIRKAQTIESNAFWNPKSIDTLVFNSYVGGASVFEYKNGNIEMLRVNKKYISLLYDDSVQSDDAIKEHYLSYADDVSRKCAFSAMQDAIISGDEKNVEVKLIGLPGRYEPVYMRVSMRVIASIDKSYVFYSILDDITVQKVAEKRVQDSETLLQSIIRNVNGGVTAIYIRNGKPKFIFSNDKYYEQLGYTKEQFEAEVDDPFSLVHTEDREKVIEQTIKASQSATSFTITYRVIKRNGSIAWFQSNIAITTLPNIKEPVQLSVANDMTEQIEASIKNDRSSEQLKRVLDVVDIGVAAVGSRLFYANHMFYSILGCAGKQLAIENILNVIPKEYQAECDAMQMEDNAVFCYGIKRLDESYLYIKHFVHKTCVSGMTAPVYVWVLTDETNCVLSDDAYDIISMIDTKSSLWRASYVRCGLFGLESRRDYTLKDISSKFFKGYDIEAVLQRRNLAIRLDSSDRWLEIRLVRCDERYVAMYIRDITDICASVLNMMGKADI